MLVSKRFHFEERANRYYVEERIIKCTPTSPTIRGCKCLETNFYHKINSYPRANELLTRMSKTEALWTKRHSAHHYILWQELNNNQIVFIPVVFKQGKQWSYPAMTWRYLSSHRFDVSNVETVCHGYNGIRTLSALGKLFPTFQLQAVKNRLVVNKFKSQWLKLELGLPPEYRGPVRSQLPWCSGQLSFIIITAFENLATTRCNEN